MSTSSGARRHHEYRRRVREATRFVREAAEQGDLGARAILDRIDAQKARILDPGCRGRQRLQDRRRLRHIEVGLLEWCDFMQSDPADEDMLGEPADETPERGPALR